MLIKVKVFPNAKKEEIIKKQKDSFEIKTRAKPINGQANKAVIELLSLYLKISKKKIKVIKGAKQKKKIFKIINLF